MLKNLASQKIAVYAHNTIADSAKTGDAANITGRYSLDGAAMSAITDTNPTELDSTNAPGIYLFDLTQAETNGAMIVFYAKSSTTGVRITPVIVDTLPAKLETAVKSLVNKAVQTKSTGTINYYDDDGSTVILTHTPADAESTITRTPS